MDSIHLMAPLLSRHHTV